MLKRGGSQNHWRKRAGFSMPLIRGVFRYIFQRVFSIPDYPIPWHFRTSFVTQFEPSKNQQKRTIFKESLKLLVEHRNCDTLQALEQIVIQSTLELINHGNIYSNRLQPSRTACNAGRLSTHHPASVRRSAGFYVLLWHYWSVNMSDLAMQYYLNIANRDGLLFTTYEARCIFARGYDLLINRFGA